MSIHRSSRRKLANKLQRVLPVNDPYARACLAFVGCLLVADNDDALIHAALQLQVLAEHVVGKHDAPAINS